MRLLLLVPLLLAACGTAPDVAAPQEVRHTGSGTVLENAQHGPELCFDVAQSLPPQCGGVPLVGWDWAQVDDEESRNGVTWGEYTVVGRWDGSTLTLTEPPTVRVPQTGDGDPVRAGCDDPRAGGRGGVAQEDLERTIGAARSAPEHAGAWVDDSVLTLAFTGHLDRHEQRARETWAGPLCLVRHARSLQELQRIADELWQGDELDVRSSWTDEVDNVVHVGVVAVTDAQQRALDERYGEGAVVVEPGLREVR